MKNLLPIYSYFKKNIEKTAKIIEKAENDIDL